MSNERLPAVEFKNFSRGWGNNSHPCPLVVEDEEFVISPNTTCDGTFNDDGGRGVMFGLEDRSVAQRHYSTVDRSQGIANPGVDNVLETPFLFPLPIPVNSPGEYDDAVNGVHSRDGNVEDMDEWIPDENASPAPFHPEDMTVCENPTKAPRKHRTYFSGNIEDQIPSSMNVMYANSQKPRLSRFLRLSMSTISRNCPSMHFPNIILPCRNTIDQKAILNYIYNNRDKRSKKYKV